MITKLQWQGQVVWLKTYSRSQRRIRLYFLDHVARMLDVPALRPPPHPGGHAACEIEARRIRALASLGVHVPPLLAEGKGALVLDDIGVTLPDRLAQSDAAQRQHWIAAAAVALAAVHAAGGYIGQPFARNLTIDAHDRIGFIDFEEDSLEAMTLVNAQVRDWLVFAAGMSRYLPNPETELSAALMVALREVNVAVVDGVMHSAARLAPVQWLTSHLGRRARRMADAIAALRRVQR